jgi:hypothetical protein
MVGTLGPSISRLCTSSQQPSEYILGKEFFAEFKKKECEEFDKTLPGLIKDWVSRSPIQGEQRRCVFDFFTGTKLQVCGHDDLSAFRKEDTAHFFVQWVPLIFRVAEGSSSIGQKYSLIICSTESPSTGRKKAAGKPVQILHVRIHHGRDMLPDAFSFDELGLEPIRRKSCA